MFRSTFRSCVLFLAFAFAAGVFPSCTTIDDERPAAVWAARGDALRATYRSNPAVLDEAAKSYEEALKLEPDLAQAHTGLIRLKGDAKNPAEELALAGTAAQKFPNDPLIQYEYAYALGNSERFAESIAAFERVRQLNPNYEHIDAQISWTYLQMGEHARAVEAGRRAVEEEPKYAWGFQQLGDALLAAGKHEDAVEAFKQSNALDPADKWSYKRLADAYINLDRYPDALATLEKAAARFPDDLIILLDHGTALQKHRRDKEAIDVLARAEKIARQELAEKPDDPERLNNLGRALEYQGKLDEARSHYARILELTREGQDHHTYALRNTASTLIKTQKYDEAVGYYRRAYASSKEPGDQRLIALILFYAGKNEESLAEMDKWFAANEIASHDGRYLSIHAHLIALAVGDKANPAKYLAMAQQSKATDWPAPCVDYLARRISEEQLLALATDNNKQTEARAYIGFRQVFTGNHAGLDHLRWVAKNGNPHYTETDQAIAYLKRTTER
jgi:tetratricopeptide (TPR) repeat protein